MKAITAPTLRLFSKNPGTALRWTSAGVFFVFCFFYGAAFALMAPGFTLPFVLLLVFPGGLVLWALPEARHAPIKTLGFLLFFQYAVKILWPAYLAINIPGWPQISPQRVTQVGFLLTFLVCLSVSAEFRSNLAAALTRVRWLTRTVACFVFLQFVSIGWSASIFSSLDQFFVAQLTWTSVFFAGCAFFLKKGRAEMMVGMLVILGVLDCALGVWENHLGTVPWAGHMPSFLLDSNALGIMRGDERYGRHRVMGPFETSLTFAEYLALMFTFALHYAVNAYKPWIRICAAISMPLLTYVIVLTQARLGMMGIFVTVVIYPLWYIAVRWRQTRHSLIAAAGAYLSPVFLSLAIASAFTVPTIHNKLFGTATVEGSTQSRFDQMHLGIPKILSHPWGYGIGLGGQALDYHLPGGKLTIDSYWLRLAMDYGPLGLVLFLSIFVAAIFYAGRGMFAGWNAERELKLLLPLGCAIIQFVTIRIAFAQEQNITFIYLFLSIIVALTYRATNISNGHEMHV